RWLKKCIAFSKDIDLSTDYADYRRFVSMSRSEICEHLRNLRFVTLLLIAPVAASAQMLAPSAVPNATPASEEETIVPTFETQKLARTYILDVPAPRGQITDRNGVPLAQNRLS